MTEIKGGIAKEQIAEEFFFSSAEAPQQVANTVQPVFNVGDKYSNVVASGELVATGSTTVYTTPTEEDFYLTNAYLNSQCDSACDSTEINLNVVVGGKSCELIHFMKFSASSYSRFEDMSFPFPIKLDRNSAITITHTYAAGNATVGASIVGFTKTTPKTRS